MFNLKYFQRLVASSTELRLTWPDRLRFLWSYYGSRLPGGEPRRSTVQEIVIRNHGRPLRAAIRTNGSDADMLDEVFARRAYDFRITGVKTILDLGGNIGMASIFFYEKFPEAKLACVEPVPDNIKMIRRNARLNSLPITIFEAAVGPKDGSTTFQVPQDPAAGYASYAGATELKRADILTVKMISVPTILDELGWERIDLLKIDIEGGEREVLAGNPDWLKRVGAIIGEGHHGFGVKYTVESVVDQLHPFGFRVHLLEQRSGGFVFVADSDPARSLTMPASLETRLGPLRESSFRA